MGVDTIVTLMSSLTALIGVFGGGAVLFYKQEKRSKELANDNVAIAQWQELLKEYKDECKEKDALLNKHRDEKVELRKKITELEVENTKLTLTHCEVKKCPKRVPPTGY